MKLTPTSISYILVSVPSSPGTMMLPELPRSEDNGGLMERRLDYPVFDADNHMYEQPDAFTRYLPDEYKNVIKYVQVNGRDKLAIKNVISEYIPNPTFTVVARPGAQAEFFKNGNPEGKSRREMLGEPIRALDAFFKPEPRLQLMDEQGVDRAIMWPTLASVLEERLHNDPEASHVIIHSLNQWMHEEWTFNYKDRIFPTPVITLPIVDEAIRELDWVVERGAKIILIRPAPVPEPEGLPLVRPARVRPVLVQGPGVRRDGRHARLRRRHDPLLQPVGGPPRRAPAVREHDGLRERGALMNRGIFDAMASAVCHGMLSAVPSHPRAAGRERVELGAAPHRCPGPLVRASSHASTTRTRSPCLRRNVWIHPFFEENPLGLIKAIGTDRVVFGSDYPHPEGLADPVSYAEELDSLPREDVEKIMGGNLAEALKIAA